MQITVTVSLDGGDSFKLKPSEAAFQVLVALGGDAGLDYCTVAMSSNELGKAGTPPAEVPAG